MASFKCTIYEVCLGVFQYRFEFWLTGSQKDILICLFCPPLVNLSECAGVYMGIFDLVLSNKLSYLTMNVKGDY